MIALKTRAKRTFDGLLLGGRIRRLPCKLGDAASIIPASLGAAIFKRLTGLQSKPPGPSGFVCINLAELTSSFGNHGTWLGCTVHAVHGVLHKTPVGTILLYTLTISDDYSALLTQAEGFEARFDKQYSDGMNACCLDNSLGLTFSSMILVAEPVYPQVVFQKIERPGGPKLSVCCTSRHGSAVPLQERGCG